MSSEVTTIVLAIFSCTGLWTLVNYFVQRHFNNKDKDQRDLKLLKEALLALLQDRLLYLCTSYISEGEIEVNQLKSLKRLYASYKDLGGNEFVHDLMNKQIDNLQIIKDK